MSKIIILGELFRIQPSHIYTGNHFYFMPGDYSTEVSANHVVRLCQKLNGWFPFTIQQIEETYNESGHKGFIFNRLIPELIVVGNDGKYYLTDEFIIKCFKSSPAVGVSLADGL